jgi:ERCC4-type nuclease
MPTLEILRDTREQKGWNFDGFDATVVDETLNTGDYTLAQFCSHEEENDTYYPEYAIERKSGSDFISSITHNRERFKNEIKRAKSWETPLKVIIEEPRNPSRYHDDYFLNYYDVTQSQVFGTVDTWERHYNVEFIFAGSRQRAEQKAFDYLSSHLRGELFSG